MQGLKINTGDKFNFLTVLKETDPKTVDDKRPKRVFICECICGRRIKVRLDSLRNNKKSSCGCQLPIKIVKTGVPVTKHGYSKHPLYKIWKHIRSRCYSVVNINYHRYGGRGIKMCNEWYNDAGKFIEWGLANGYKEGFGLELDRENNNDGYFPDNCRWVTSEINNNNKRNNKKYLYKGGWFTLPQISRIEGWIGFPTLYRRINENKLSLEEALAIPINGKCTKNPNPLRLLKYEQVVDILTTKRHTEALSRKHKIHTSTIERIRRNESYLDFIEKYKQECA